MRFSTQVIVQGFFVMSLLPSVVSAAIWAQPTGPTYTFDSLGTHTVVDTPFGTLVFTGTGPTVARSDPTNAAFTQGGLDTINTEILSLTLTGTFSNVPAVLQAGANNGIYPGLQATRGQVQDLAGAPNGQIDFPANSIFDVFFDVWVDISNPGIVDLGEVFSNYTRFPVRNYAARMSTMPFDIPPPVGTTYTLAGGVLELDPMIGTFEATQFGPVDLYQIGLDREPLGELQPFGRLDEAAHQVLTVASTVPEPGSPWVWSVISLLGACLGWRRKRQEVLHR